jgi:hypothetical protein
VAVEFGKLSGEVISFALKKHTLWELSPGGFPSLAFKL